MTSVILLAEIEFELTSPAAVGAPERQQSQTAELQQIARDGWGNPWIPPSSLAGSFRAHLPADLAPVLMGEEGEDGEDGGGTGRASLVRFLGTELHLPPGTGPLHRSRTALDTRRGAAAAGTLRNEEYLPTGTRVICRLRADGTEHRQTLQDALLSWRPVLGRGRTTGHGTVRTVGVRLGAIDLDTPHGLRQWLTTGGPDLFRTADLPALALPEPATSEPLLPSTRWEITEALHIGTGEHRAQEAARIVRDDQRRPYIPGTTWKGLLRSRTAYVLRSLGLPACAGLGGACGGCAVCTAFGWTGGGGEGARGLLRFPDTPITGALVTERRHVAIDRFTGGARDGQLFTDEVVERGTVDLAIHTDGDIPATARAALALALWDLHSGVLGLGGGTTRGYGTLRCTDPAPLEHLRAAAWRTLAHD